MMIILLVIILFLPCTFEWTLSTVIYGAGIYFLYVYFRTNYLKRFPKLNFIKKWV